MKKISILLISGMLIMPTHSHARSGFHAHHTESSPHITEPSERAREQASTSAGVIGGALTGAAIEDTRRDDNLPAAMDGYPIDGTPGAFPAATPEDQHTDHIARNIGITLGCILLMLALVGAVSYLRARREHQVNMRRWDLVTNPRFRDIIPGLHVYLCPFFFQTTRVPIGDTCGLHFTPNTRETETPVRCVGVDGPRRMHLYLDTQRTDFFSLAISQDGQHIENDAYFFSFIGNISDDEWSDSIGEPTYTTSDGCVWKRSWSRENLGRTPPVQTTELSVDYAHIHSQRHLTTMLYERDVRFVEDYYPQKEYLLIRSVDIISTGDRYHQLYAGVSLDVDQFLPSEIIGEYCEH